METRRWLFYVAVNWILVYYIVAKPFSLNKLIESESKRNEVIQTRPHLLKIEESTPAAERFSLNRELKPSNRIPKKFTESGRKINLASLGKKISPLKYRKTFQIKSPLKPKRVKNSLRTRHKRKNQSFKREVDGNDILSKKYVPLLRSLGMLFDNILGSGSGESFEIPQRKQRLRYFFSDEDISYKSPHRRESSAELEQEEKTTTTSEATTPEIAITTEVTTATANNPPDGNFRGFRHHKNIPLLLPRNTSSSRRNHFRFSERGSAAYNGSLKRNISRYNGDSEFDTKRRQEQSNTKSDEEYTHSTPRNDASSNKFQGTVPRRKYRNSNEEVNKNDTTTQDETSQYNGTYKLKAERDKTKSRKFLPKFIRKPGRFLSRGKNLYLAKSIQSEENNEKGVVSITHDGSSGERLADSDGPYTAEDKKIDSGTETVTPKPYKQTAYLSAKRGTTEKFMNAVPNLEGSEQNSNNIENDINNNFSDDITEQNRNKKKENSNSSRSSNIVSEPKLRNKTVFQQPLPELNTDNDINISYDNFEQNIGSQESDQEVNNRHETDQSVLENAGYISKQYHDRSTLDDSNRDSNLDNHNYSFEKSYDDNLNLKSTKSFEKEDHNEFVFQNPVNISEIIANYTLNHYHAETTKSKTGYDQESFENNYSDTENEPSETGLPNELLQLPRKITEKSKPLSNDSLNNNYSISYDSLEQNRYDTHHSDLKVYNGSGPKVQTEFVLRQSRDKQLNILARNEDHEGENNSDMEHVGFEKLIEKVTTNPIKHTLNTKLNAHTQRQKSSPKNSATSKTSQAGPVVTIIDGYSVTRHKNGDNKLTKRAIRIRS